MVKIIEEENGVDKINRCFDVCGLQALNYQEIEFLKEYCKVMFPLSCSLDILQQDTNMYMGFLLPVIVTLEDKLNSLKNKGLKFCVPLLDSILHGIQKRFKALFSNSDLIMSTCLHPKFKFDWLTNEMEKNEAMAKIKQLIEIDLKKNTDEEQKEISDSFFNFNKPKKDGEELKQYIFSSSESLSVLEMFPKMKKLFIKFNTTLPSSASVERLFSVAGLVITPKRSNLSDENFEKQ